MGIGGRELGRRWGGRKLALLLAAAGIVVAAAAVGAVLATRGGGSGAADAAGSSCDAYGPSWVRSYNRKAVAQGNPVRMLSACCRSTSQAGVHHCFIRVTLTGTKDLGCETVDLGPDGTPAGAGKHESCALHR